MLLNNLFKNLKNIHYTLLNININAAGSFKTAKKLMLFNIRQHRIKQLNKMDK